MRSMTGYGRRQLELDGREMTMEIKTVNHRFLDVSFRLPRNVGFLEEPLRRRLAERLKRGHADVFINYRNLRRDAREVRVDEALLAAYQQAAAQAEHALNVKNDMKLSKYLTLPDVLTVAETEEDQQAVLLLAGRLMDQVLDDVTAMRGREGDAMRADLALHTDRLEALAAQIGQKAPTVAEEYRKRLEARLAELPITPVEPQRLAQEVALFADKCAIDEELSRLSSHIGQLRILLDAQEEAGRRLDFLVQELNREVNTIGSKASDSEITNWVVGAKSEIEKLREQVQNIE